MPKKQRIYDYFSEFASEALHIVIFENFVKSMTSCLSKWKVTPSFCFAFKIHDDVTATNINIFYGKTLTFDFSFTWLFFLLQWEDPRISNPTIAGPAIPYNRDYKRKYEYLKQQLKKPNNVPNKFEIKVNHYNRIEIPT